MINIIRRINHFIISLQKRKEAKYSKQKSNRAQNGFTIMELMVTLAILSLLTVTMFSINLSEKGKLTERAFNEECEKTLYTLLQYQNEAIMDGNYRQVRLLDNGMQISWTKDKVHHIVFIPANTFSYTGSYTKEIALNLYGHGTVSQGGTVNLVSPIGVTRKIIVQLGNGRIYLDEP
ncbi:prepilin-type N-terminal cleavage/methylation domain-containing protein [Acetobacterium paludosum]|nr:prepilin-type N-terminal cleavage/methylation domain-containing protein [Acetobacterium paludosum]